MTSWITTFEAAELAGVSPATIRNRKDDGTLIAKMEKDGQYSRLLFDRDDVAEWAEHLPEPPEGWLSVDEAAHRSYYSRTIVLAWCRAGKIKAELVNRKWWICPQPLDEWMERK